MPIDTELVKLYGRPINVWVEDALSSEYLNELWREPRALFLIAGATDSVRPVVTHAVRNGAKKVFGIVDRDFEESNHSRWGNPGLFHFILPVHEMENYVLDASAIAACGINNQNRTEADIEARMQGRARALLVWMTACQVIKQIRRVCFDQFIDRPTAASLASAADISPYIQGASWYQTFAARSSQINSAQTLQTWIDDATTQLTQDLQTGNWKRTFSGKEILRDVRGFVYRPIRSAPLSVHDIDLAQSVARWQADNGKIPVELTELLNHLRTKAGL